MPGESCRAMRKFEDRSPCLGAVAGSGRVHRQNVARRGMCRLNATMSLSFLQPRSFMCVALMVVVISSCRTSAAAQAPAEPAKAKDGKDYAPLRIRGRQIFQLPGIGTLHADKIEQVPGGELRFFGRVFVERLETAKDSVFRFAYAPSARWDDVAGILTMEGEWVFESAKIVVEGRAPHKSATFDRKGVFTANGGHQTRVR